MTQLVDDLLFLARTDGGHTRGLNEIVHLDELVLDVAERFAPLAQQRHVQIQVDALPDLAVLGDRLYLARLLGNLVENALKYSGPDGGSVGIALTTHGQDGAQWACLTVSDDGPGIAADHLPHIFERFYRADVARTHSTDAVANAVADAVADGGDTSERAGSGLGLAIVRWIAQAHGGDITITSEVGAGVACVVALPLYRVSDC